VTKFRQNRLTLKGRSAGQRHTDRHTGANFKIYLLRQFCSIRVEFFTIHRRHRRKNDRPELWNSNSVILKNFLKFSKRRRRAVPLRPIWTIMVAAKLDQSEVLVTKFHQNRLTLKGRSAGQRHTDTDRHTDKLGWKQWPFRFAIGPTDRPRSHVRYSVCNNRPHYSTHVLRCDLKVIHLTCNHTPK